MYLKERQWKEEGRRGEEREPPVLGSFPVAAVCQAEAWRLALHPTSHLGGRAPRT